MARRRKDKGAREKKRGAAAPDAAASGSSAAGPASAAPPEGTGAAPPAAGDAPGAPIEPNAGAGGETPDDAPPPVQRPGLAVRIGIGLFILIQMLLPLRYYTISENPYDERFAWRMFSPIRMLSCDPQFRLDGERLPLETEFHTAWITLLKRGRPAVVEEAGRHLCERYPEEEITFYYRCRELDGEVQVLNDGSESICEDRQ